MKKTTMRVLLMFAALALFVVPIAVIAADTFTDVPDSNVFHDDIAWLAAAGVTKGCNPPTNDKFCPSSDVTREQMAAFMHRLADSQAVDAGELAGAGPSSYQSVVSSSAGSLAHSTGLGLISAGAPFSITSVDIDAPTAGVLLIDASSGWEGGDVWFTQWLEMDEGTACDDWNSTDRLPGSGTESNTTTSSAGYSINSSIAIEVPAGSTTIDLCIWPFSSTVGSQNVSFSLVTQWVPVSSSSILTPAGTSGSSSDTPAGGPSSG